MLNTGNSHTERESLDYCESYRSLLILDHSCRKQKTVKWAFIDRLDLEIQLYVRTKTSFSKHTGFFFVFTYTSETWEQRLRELRVTWTARHTNALMFRAIKSENVEVKYVRDFSGKLRSNEV